VCALALGEENFLSNQVGQSALPFSSANRRVPQMPAHFRAFGRLSTSEKSVRSGFLQFLSTVPD
jgi:hypothetical protein